MSIDYTKFGNGEAPGQATVNKTWWKSNKKDLAQSVTAIINTLAQYDTARQTQYQISTKLYGNVNLTGLNGMSYTKISAVQNGMKDRVTYNIVQSTVDTITAKMSKNKPKPLFLTSGGDYKIQRRAKKLDKFCEGIFYENEAYKLGPQIFRDACVFGDGVIHVYNNYGRIKWERVLASELYTDTVESFYGKPRQMHRVKNVDRGVLIDLFPEYKKDILLANSATANLTGVNQNIADLVTVAESWHLPSGPEADDGLHTITISDKTLFTEKYDKDFFPFVFLHWSKRMYGVWGQGLAEQLQSIQLEINKILWVIQRSMHLHGTYRVWIKTGSKLPKEHINNDIGAVLVSDEKPEYLSSTFIPQEYFAHLQTLKNQGFEQAGISQLSAAAKKPSGLDSGKALREFNDIESERFMVIGQAYEQMFLDLAKISISLAKDIYSEDKTYKVQVPGKKFIDTIDWKDIDLADDEYTMKVFPISSFSNDPSARLQEVQEWAQAGYFSPRQAKRLLNFPDLEAEDVLNTAQEDYLHMILEKITEEGEYTVPEPLDDLQLARELALEYYSSGKNQGLEEDKLELLRRFLDQIGILEQKAMPPAAPMQPGGAPQAVPQAPPISDLIKNTPQAS
jgi:hypothetical protein